jgi:hypothetical protein
MFRVSSAGEAVMETNALSGGLVLMKKAEIISAAVDLSPARSKMNETDDRLSSLKWRSGRVRLASFVLIRS